jgi:hypothetical protein
MPIDNYDALVRMRLYPAMNPPESEIVRKWLTAHREGFDRIEFNVRLGDGEQWPDHFDEETRRIGQLQTQKRADVVAWRGDSPTLIEVKPRIGFSALGQLLGYRVLWRKTFPERQLPALVAIGETAVSEAAEVFAEHGVSVELVS